MQGADGFRVEKMGLPMEGAVAVCNQLFSMVDGVAIVITGSEKRPGQDQQVNMMG